MALVVATASCSPRHPSGESSIDKGQDDSGGSLGQHDSGRSIGHEDLAFGTPNALDVVTWNIEEFPKNGQTTAAVADILQGMDADLFALQEISDVDAFEQMVDELPGWEGYVQSEWYAGLAYLYRTDVIEVGRNYEIYTTEQFWGAFPRSPQVMEFRFRNQEFVVINNHFKCCGDGRLDPGDSWDEETRRMDATNLIKAYIDTHLSESKVIVLGDLNDSLTDMPEDNVFASLLNDPDNYLFADMGIAEGESALWSFPSYPSHLDHILISNELFDDFEHPDSWTLPLPVDETLFDGLWDYQQNVSDHRPVALKITLDE